MGRTLLAFLIAPFPAALLQAWIVALWPKENMGVFEHPVSMFVAICLYFYIFGLLLGVPLMWVFRKRPAGWRGYAWGGAAVMVAPIVVALVVAAVRGELSAYVALYNLGFFAAGGAAAGRVFFHVRLSRRVRG